MLRLYGCVLIKNYTIHGENKNTLVLKKILLWEGKLLFFPPHVVLKKMNQFFIWQEKTDESFGRIGY